MKNCKKEALSFAMFVCLSTCNNTRTAQPFFKKFYTGGCYLKFSARSNFGENWVKITDTSHEDAMALWCPPQSFTDYIHI
jgi:hypothetical protein